VAELRVSIWDHPKFRRPTEAVGDWHVRHRACFEHDSAPTAMKRSIETLTRQLLQREPLDLTEPSLRYASTSGAGGHPSSVRLELIGMRVGAGPGASSVSYLYALSHERSAPRRWEDEQRFTADCAQRFAHWCEKLTIVADEQSWPRAPRAALEQCVRDVVAAEDAAACVVEDMAPVLALQRQVLDGLRGGMVFFTAGKEGGSHLVFDGKVYRRDDYGDQPQLSFVYADDAAMVEALRRFYDWEAHRDCYPHPKPELEVWQYIHSRLRTR
jgi:hypothetical protein